MPKRDRTREALEALSAALEQPRSEAATGALRQALRARSNLLVSAALAHIEAHELEGFDAEIEAAFTAALHKDPGCRTKTAAVKALDHLGVPADEVFLAGVRCVQAEPVWGGSVDVAAELRARSAMALVHRRHPEAMVELARALADPEREVRCSAAEGVSASGDLLTGVPLLMLKLSAGDDEPEVLSACFAALLDLDPEHRFEYVADAARGPDQARGDAAVLALGQARPPGAIAVLSQLFEARVGESRKLAALSLAMLREDAAWAYLIERVRCDDPPRALDAIAALAVYRELGELRARVYAAIAQRSGDSAALEDAAYQALG